MEAIKLQENEFEVIAGELNIENETKENVVEVISGEVIVEAEEALDLIILKSVAPVIQSNYEVLKDKINNKLESYKNSKVTEENLNKRKKDQKELASLRIKLDASRKEKKKELEKPIKEFDSQCLELIELVKETETPLKEGISVFDEKKKEEFKKYAKEYFNKASEGIEEKFKAFTVPKECDTLKVSKKAIRIVVDAQIELMLTKQNAENEKIATIKAAIDAQNERNVTKLSFDSFHFIIDSGAALSDILMDITKRGQDIYDAEHKIAEVEIQIPQVIETKYVENAAFFMSIPEETTFINEDQQNNLPTIPVEMACVEAIMSEAAGMCEEKESIVPMYEIVFKVKGTYNEIKNLSDYINNNQIQKEIISQIQL